MIRAESLLAPVARAPAEYKWPDGFPRIPDEDWVRQGVDTFGVQYDHVGDHGWYKNLDPIVAQVLATLDQDKVMVDYSSGTGILTKRILAHVSYPVGILNVDASPKFLRVAVENFREDERVAFRLMRFLKQQRRLQLLDEVVEPSLFDRGVDILTSTNAIHLYYDLMETLGSWHRILRPGALALVASGNIRNPHGRIDDWIIDETVARINNVATEVVRTSDAFSDYREALEDSDRMKQYRQQREKVFVPVRPLDYYLDSFEESGFTVLHVFETTIYARIDEWHNLLTAYHDGVLPWVGGSQKVDGRPPTAKAVNDRIFLIKYCLEKLFPGQSGFPCSWTYITCRRR